MKLSSIRGFFTRLFKFPEGRHSSRNEAIPSSGPSNATNSDSTETLDIPGSWQTRTGNQSSLATRSTTHRTTILSDISEERSVYSNTSRHEDLHQDLEVVVSETRSHGNADSSLGQSLPGDASENDASSKSESEEQPSSDEPPAISNSGTCNDVVSNALPSSSVDRLQTPSRPPPQAPSASTPALTVGGETVLSTFPVTPVNEPGNRSQALRRKQGHASLRVNAHSPSIPSSTSAVASGSPLPSPHLFSAVEAARGNSPSPSPSHDDTTSGDHLGSQQARSGNGNQQGIQPNAMAVEEAHVIAVVPPGLVHQHPTPSPLPIFSNSGRPLNEADRVGDRRRGDEGYDTRNERASGAPESDNRAAFPQAAARDVNNGGQDQRRAPDAQGNPVQRPRVTNYPSLLGSPAFVPGPYRIPAPVRPSRAANYRVLEPSFDYSADRFAAVRLPPKQWRCGDFLAHRDQSFEILREIGGGAYGFVWYATDKDNKEVAIKVVNKRMLLDTFAEERAQGVFVLDEDSPRKMIINEFLALKRLTEHKARQSTPLLNAFTDASNVYFVMRHYSCTLREYLKYAPRLTSFQKRLFTAELICAVSELHGMKIVHRDIKPENVFLTPSGHLILGDFGISDVFPLNTSMEITTQYVGTPTYMAPELMGNPGQMRLGQYKTDIYSLAITILEIFIGTGERWYEIFAKKPRKKRNEDPKFWSPLFLLSYVDDGDAMELVHDMLQERPEKRPEWTEIFKSPYLTVLNREGVAARQINSGAVPCASRKTNRDVSSTLDSFHRECGPWKLYELANYMERLARGGRGPDAEEINKGIDFECSPDVRNELTHGVSCFRGRCEHNYSLGRSSSSQ